jgi:predicted signal transduction protein with EAL and GGDEF domain
VRLDDASLGIVTEKDEHRHSGLSYMLKLGVDIIKIERCLLLPPIATRQPLSKLWSIWHATCGWMVAEGVENFEPGMHLRTLGVRLARGYVFAPPLLVPPARRSHRSFAARRCGRDRAYQSVGLKHWLRRNEKGRPCDRPV